MSTGLQEKGARLFGAMHKGWVALHARGVLKAWTPELFAELVNATAAAVAGVAEPEIDVDAVVASVLDGHFVQGLAHQPVSRTALGASERTVAAMVVASRTGGDRAKRAARHRMRLQQVQQTFEDVLVLAQHAAALANLGVRPDGVLRQELLAMNAALGFARPQPKVVERWTLELLLEVRTAVGEPDILSWYRPAADLRSRSSAQIRADARAAFDVFLCHRVLLRANATRMLRYGLRRLRSPHETMAFMRVMAPRYHAARSELHESQGVATFGETWPNVVDAANAYVSAALTVDTVTQRYMLKVEQQCTRKRSAIYAIFRRAGLTDDFLSRAGARGDVESEFCDAVMHVQLKARAYEQRKVPDPKPGRVDLLWPFIGKTIERFASDRKAQLKARFSRKPTKVTVRKSALRGAGPRIVASIGPISFVKADDDPGSFDRIVFGGREFDSVEDAVHAELDGLATRLRDLVDAVLARLTPKLRAVLEDGHFAAAAGQPLSLKLRQRRKRAWRAFMQHLAALLKPKGYFAGQVPRSPDAAPFAIPKIDPESRRLLLKGERKQLQARRQRWEDALLDALQRYAAALPPAPIAV